MGSIDLCSSFVLVSVGVDVFGVMEYFEGRVVFNIIFFVEVGFFSVVDFGEFDVFFFERSSGFFVFGGEGFVVIILGSED